MFNDKQLEKLTTWFKYAENKFNGRRLDEFYREVPYEELKPLIARLEAAELALLSCEYYKYDDGLVIIEEPDVKLYEAWLWSKSE